MALSLFRTLHKEEIAAVDFWATRRNPKAWDILNDAIFYYNEIVSEAGPHGEFCEYTAEKLKKVAADVNETIDYYIERISDWASD
jgi:hypothetical protein